LRSGDSVAGNCPRCGELVSPARLESLTLTDGSLRVKSFAAICPNMSCQAIIGVMPDNRRSVRVVELIATALKIPT
jgi:hypothetical protein